MLYGVLLLAVFPPSKSGAPNIIASHSTSPCHTNKDTLRLCGDHSINIANRLPAMLFSSPPHQQAFPFKPYEFKAFRSDAKHRKKRKTPEGIFTCWEINTLSSTTWVDTVPCCTPCGRFKAEKGITPRLSKLKSNRDPVKVYQCDTLWQDSKPKKKNNVVAPAASYKPTKESPP